MDSCGTPRGLLATQSRDHFVRSIGIHCVPREHTLPSFLLPNKFPTFFLPVNVVVSARQAWSCHLCVAAAAAQPQRPSQSLPQQSPSATCHNASNNHSMPLPAWWMTEETRNRLLKQYRIPAASAASTLLATLSVVCGPGLHLTSHSHCLAGSDLLTQLDLHHTDPLGELEDSHADVSGV